MTKTAWQLIRVDQGTKQSKCDACGRGVRGSMDHIRNTETGEVLHVGQGCAAKFYGIRRNARVVPAEVEPTAQEMQASMDFLLSWMNGDE